MALHVKGVKAVDDSGELSVDILRKVPKPTIAHVGNNRLLRPVIMAIE